MPKNDVEGGSRAALAGIGAIALAAALWAIAATVASDLFDAGVSPVELAEARAVISALGLALLPAARKAPARGARGRIVAVGLAIALVNATYYLAIDRLPVAVAVVVQYTAPALVVLWVAFETRRRPSSAIAAAVVTALAGVVLIAELPAGNLGALDAVGLLFAISTAFLFASYSILSATATDVYGTVGTVFRAFVVAALFWVAFQLPRGWPEEVTDVEHLPEVIYVGIAGTLLPFVCYVWGLRRVRAERASIAATLEPVLAALVAWVWLGQTLSPMQVAGGLLVIGAVASLQVQRREGLVAPEP